MEDRRRHHRLPRLVSVRARTTAAAMVVVAVALAICSVTLIHILREALVKTVDDSNSALANDITAKIESGTLPRFLAVPGGAGGGDTVLQVVDTEGKVLSASPNFVLGPPLLSYRPAEHAKRYVDTLHGPVVDPKADFRVLAITKRSPDFGLVAIFSASQLEQSTQTQRRMRRALGYGAPGLTVLVGLLVWWLVGRALRPVESIRSQVAEITATALDRRVPEPPIKDEIGRLARTMNAMLDRLESSVERQRRFVSDASHELRSPLTASQAQLEVALAHPETNAWPQIAAGVLDENLRMTRLVNDLLVLARSDEGTFEVTPGGVDLDDIVFAEVDRLRDRGRVDVDVSRVSGGRVQGHSEHLQRVVRNLVENAERHTSSMVAVELGTVDGNGSGPRVELAVTDDGPGVAPEDRERVFHRFTRLDAGRSRDRGGSGLGLAIVKEIVMAHGGRIWVEEGPGGGARFVVELPAG
jgi:signal transduction histidine kinase